MHIEEAASGEDALAQAAAMPPDFVFMDLRLQGKNGLDTTRELKSSLAYAAVCVITSFDVPEYREAARRCGADHFLVKGEASEAQIVSTVDSLLSSRVKCLIIEDNAHFRQHLESELSRHWPSMLVAAAEDDREGLEDLAALKPELVILDLHLPHCNGIALARTIRAQCPLAELIILSNHDLPEYREAATSAGATYFIAKGDMDGEPLVEIVQAVLLRRAARMN